jgi:hypothetical protein
LAFITDFLEAGSFVRQFTQEQREIWKKKSPSREGNYGRGLIGWTEKKEGRHWHSAGGANANSFSWATERCGPEIIGAPLDGDECEWSTQHMYSLPSKKSQMGEGIGIGIGIVVTLETLETWEVA